MNVAFNSVFHYDSTLYDFDGKIYRYLGDPATKLEVSCFDHDVEPDSAMLNTHLKNTVKKFNSLKEDSAAFDSVLNRKNAVIELGAIDLDRGFFGLYKITKKFIEDSTHFFVQYDTYNYDEHCFCEFKFKRSYYTDSASLQDTARINQFVQGLDTRSLQEVRQENKKIREYYELVIDTLPLYNYWIRVYHKNGKMVRDSIFMENLDSAEYLPRFTHYNRTYKANIIITPGLMHKFNGIELKNLKSYEVKGDTITIELRDAEGGIISRRGTISIENSLGYPIDLPFQVTYYNHLYEKLRRVRD